MPSRVLARRIAALITCRLLHQSGELDDNLQPIGKEGFLASEPDWENFELAKTDEDILHENSEPRPGTTKRRQYYYKRVTITNTTRLRRHSTFKFSDCVSVFGLSAESWKTGVLVSHKNDAAMSHSGGAKHSRQKNLSARRFGSRIRCVNFEGNTKDQFISHIYPIG